jgi:hypothetical protein
MSIFGDMREAGFKSRAGLIGAALLLFVGLSACTTIEGTNALVDAETFEREVANVTLSGLGIIDKPEQKDSLKTARAPLVLPKDLASLPSPTKVADDILPEDSDKVQIDTANLSEEDLRRLRNARVFDPRTVAGRPLTKAETAQLTARLGAVRVQKGVRPLALPPEEYFTTVNGQDLICLAPNGDLVPLDDPACPAEIREALAGI